MRLCHRGSQAGYPSPFSSILTRAILVVHLSLCDFTFIFNDILFTSENTLISTSRTDKMKSAIYAGLLAYAVQNVAAHATFQELWIDGVDQGTTCARTPLSNSPVTDVTSDDMACNAGTSAVSSKCAVTAGSTVTVEMHQQPNDRSCSNEAIGGAHYGPVLVYLSAVSDSSTAVGSDGSWFKIFEDTWASGGGSTGSDDYWGTKDLNTCCGRMDVLIPDDIAPGDYLLR
jgi:lytic cellulose monooxygenase (C1-hydroxylating)